MLNLPTGKEEAREEFLRGKMLLINKPLRWTSFDVVNKVRYILKSNFNIKKIKVGHAGTLDPLATGLLILCTGKATKQIAEYQNLDKEYTGIITLGATTPCYDLEQEINERFSLEGVSEEAIQKAANQLTGTYDQTPPVFSAKRVNGKKSYERARKGEEVLLKKNKITISSFEVERIELPDVHFRITCSKGTYIRSVAHDLGKQINNGGHLSRLCRTKIGNHEIGSAVEVTSFEQEIKNLED